MEITIKSLEGGEFIKLSLMYDREHKPTVLFFNITNNGNNTIAFEMKDLIDAIAFLKDHTKED